MGKICKTHEILGCSFIEFRNHVESLWDIDNKIPLDSDKSIEGVVRLNHYTNLQPLCSHYNRRIKKK